MMAFNQSDGKQLWSFDLVPMTGPGSDTWPPDSPENPRTGGATWTSYTLDPATGLRDFPTLKVIRDYRGINAEQQLEFGVYADVVVPAEVSVGDTVEPLP